MKKKSTIKELVSKLNKKGFEITYRTFWYYIELGLIPKPPETLREGRGVHGFYPSAILKPLAKMLALRDKGHSLKSLKGRL